METLLKIIIISSVIIVAIVDTSVIINRWEDDCVLDDELVKEIASYANVTKHIMEEVRTSFGLGIVLSRVSGFSNTSTILIVT